MLPERWEEIKEKVKAGFEVEDEGVYEDEEHGGTITEYIEFSGPLGRLRLEFETRAKLLETKTKYHKRIGSETTVKNVYSPTEKAYSLGVYKYDEATDDWIPFDNNLFS
jgi:hypothetical protein